MNNLSSEILDRINDLIYGRSLLCFHQARMPHLERQIRERARARGLSSFEDYYCLLETDYEEFESLIEIITTKQTFFFRLPEQFKALGKVVLPKIEEKLAKEAQRMMVDEGGPGPWKVPLRIWSAASSTGEEPFSIAMESMENMKYPRAWSLEILASDISREAVTTMSLGFYEHEVLRKIPSPYQEKYLSVLPGGVLVSKELFDNMTFKVFNLRHLSGDNVRNCPFQRMEGVWESIDLYEYFHIIFCRNVMIYFDLAAQQRLVDGLYACLKPGGYLFTGDAELLYVHNHDFETHEYEGAFFYRKPDPEENICRTVNR